MPLVRKLFTWVYQCLTKNKAYWTWFPVIEFSIDIKFIRTSVNSSRFNNVLITRHQSNLPESIKRKLSKAIPSACSPLWSLLSIKNFVSGTIPESQNKIGWRMTLPHLSFFFSVWTKHEFLFLFTGDYSYFGWYPVIKPWNRTNEHKNNTFQENTLFRDLLNEENNTFCWLKSNKLFFDWTSPLTRKILWC